MSSIFSQLEEHFAKSPLAPPVMMGGDRDASSKGVIGTCRFDDNQWLLLLVKKNFAFHHFKCCYLCKDSCYAGSSLSWKPAHRR